MRFFKKGAANEAGCLNTEYSILLLLVVGCISAVADARYSIENSFEAAGYALSGNYMLLAKSGGPDGGGAGAGADPDGKWQDVPGGSEEVFPEPE